MKRTRYLMVFAVILAISGYFLATSGEAESKSDSDYSFVEVIRRDLGQSVIATGIIKPKVGAEVKVGAQVSGIVKELYVEVGSFIKKGELLAQIEPDVYQAKTDQAKAVKKTAATEKKYAELELNRVKKLYQSNVISEQQLENASQRYELACAKLDQAEADLNYASLQLGYTKITSPINGVIASISTQKGETVATSFATPTFVTIIDLNRLELWAYVDETDIGRISKKQKVSFTVDTYPAESFNGIVETVYPKAEIINNVVNYITVIEIINERDRTLRPEMTATVEIFSELRENVLALPKRAVQFENGKAFVNILNNENIEKQYISTGISNNKYYEVLSGLEENQKVILPSSALFEN